MTNKNIVDEMYREFYDDFADTLYEVIFCYMTETSRGYQRSTLHERVENINQLMIGEDMQKLIDDESELMHYDEFFMQNSQICARVIDRMLKEFTARYTNDS